MALADYLIIAAWIIIVCVAAAELAVLLLGD